MYAIVITRDGVAIHRKDGFSTHDLAVDTAQQIADVLPEGRQVFVLESRRRNPQQIGMFTGGGPLFAPRPRPAASPGPETYPRSSPTWRPRGAHRAEPAPRDSAHAQRRMGIDEMVSEVRAIVRPLAQKYGVPVNVRKGRGSSRGLVHVYERLDSGGRSDPSPGFRIVLVDALMAAGFEDGIGAVSLEESQELARTYGHGRINFHVFNAARDSDLDKAAAARRTALAARPAPFFFPRLNKQNRLEEYLEQPNENWDSRSAKVTETIEITPERWAEIANGLLATIPEVAGKGGTDSTMDTDGRSYLELSEPERELWRRGSYALLVELAAPGYPSLFVDPQGYDYARYVAFRDLQKALDGNLSTDIDQIRSTYAAALSRARGGQYERLGDAAAVTGNHLYDPDSPHDIARPIQIWYYKRPLSMAATLGHDGLERSGQLPTPETLLEGYGLIGEISGLTVRPTELKGDLSPMDSAISRIRTMMQGEVWSPQGQARGLVERAGVGHTSMSPGDMFEYGGVYYMLEPGPTGGARIVDTMLPDWS